MAWRYFFRILILASVLAGGRHASAQPGNIFNPAFGTYAAYVSAKNGNDLNAQIGNPFAPFQNLKTAFQVAQRMNPSNAVVILAPAETNNIDNILTGTPIIVSNNCTVTMIAYGAYIVQLTDATCDMLQMTGNSGFVEYGGTWVCKDNAGSGVPSPFNSLGVSGHACYLFNLYGVQVISPSDWFFGFSMGSTSGAQPANMRLDGCQFFGAWDGLFPSVLSSSRAGSLLEVYNSRFVITNTIYPNATDIHGMELGGGNYILSDDLINVTWTAANNGGAKAIGLDAIAGCNLTLKNVAIVATNITPSLGVQIQLETGSVLSQQQFEPIYTQNGQKYSAHNVPRPHSKRCSVFQAYSTQFGQFGESVTQTGTASSQAPTATEGQTVNEATAASIGSTAGISGNVVLRTGRNVYFATSAKLQENAVERAYLCVTDQTLATMGAADNPAGNYAGFLYSTTMADTTHWYIVAKDGTTQNAVATTFAVDTNIHKFEVVFDDAVPNILFLIDGGVVGTLSANLPSASTNMRGVGVCETGEAVAKNIRFEWMYMECDR